MKVAAALLTSTELVFSVTSTNALGAEAPADNKVSLSSGVLQSSVAIFATHHLTLPSDHLAVGVMLL